MLGGFLLLFSVHDGWGGPPTNELKSAIDKVVQVLKDPSLKKGTGRVKERRTAIRQVANEIFDFTEMAKRILAPPRGILSAPAPRCPNRLDWKLSTVVG